MSSFPRLRGARSAHRHGLVLGKFYPPHAGHHHLIDTAKASCDRLTVLVMYATVESIPGQLRHRWIAERHPDVHVVSCRDDFPVDYGDPATWDLHMKGVFGAVPDPVDVVFSSERYGAELARRLGAEEVLVDLSRAAFPISGTAVRRDPRVCWPWLEPAVRAYLCRRIVVLGAESTGTTTLARSLAEHYETSWVPEYGRGYSQAKTRAGRGADWAVEDFVVIAARQQAAEEAAARTAGPVLVCDTDAIATTVFEELYLGATDPATSHVAASRPPAALYLLTSHEDVPFEDDGTRLFEDRRPWMTERLREILAAQGTPWLELHGAHDQRMVQATTAVDRLLTKWHFADPLG